jgi:hypothetical protein
LVFTDGRVATGKLVGAAGESIVLSDLKTGPAGVAAQLSHRQGNEWAIRRSDLIRAEVFAGQSHKLPTHNRCGCIRRGGVEVLFHHARLAACVTDDNGQDQPRHPCTGRKPGEPVHRRFAPSHAR